MEQCVRQESVLSPMLFLVVMDPLLHQLNNQALVSPSTASMLVFFLHADDIRALASSVSSKEEQVAMVQKFVRENLLKLNAQKCEIVVFLRNQTKQFPECSIDGEVITAVLDVHFGTPRILFHISS